METKYYKCKLLSDIVINAQTATEGSPKCLDYIPGANFLGLVAQELYTNVNADTARKIFHSGDVKFGDARISKNDHLGNKVPAAWFFPKGENLTTTESIKVEGQDETKDKTTTRVHHKIKDDLREKLIDKGIQLKQARTGYFLPSGELINIQSTYTQKSAYDSENRRSRDEQMFGYQSLPQGSEFIFKIEYNIDDETIREIENAICGERRMGRSKTAQYGMVKINKHSELKSEFKSNFGIGNSELIIYAESDLCFFDKYGEPTLQPTAKDFGLIEDDDKTKNVIDWSKTQIRHRSYAPWNGKRQTREADRIVIEKGSVIVIENAEWKNGKEPKTCVGAYTAEGLGKVIYNPSFLEAEEDGRLTFALTENKEKDTGYNFILDKDADTDNKVLNLIKSRKTTYDDKLLILGKIEDFNESNAQRFINQKISKSQWGQVRQIAHSSPSFEKLNNSLFKGIESDNKEDWKGFLIHGKNEWGKPLASILKDELNKDIREYSENEIANKLNDSHLRIFAEKLAAQMQKQTQKTDKP